MRDIWFVDSADAQAFHLFPDCAALNQSVQPIMVEQVDGLAEVIGTERYGDLWPCEKCRQRMDRESAETEWGERATSSAATSDAIAYLTKGEGMTPAMRAGDEPLRVFQQNFVKLKVFNDRFELKQPTLFGGEETAIPFAEVVELRAVPWIPIVQPPAVEIDSAMDGEVFTDRFEMSIMDSPEMVVSTVGSLAGLSDAPPLSGGAGTITASRAGPPAATPPPAARTLPPAAEPGSYGEGLRGELARMYDEGRQCGGSFFGADGAAFGGSGWDWADGVLAGCNDAESLKNYAELLDEQVRLARFFIEANAIITTVESWNRLEVTVDGCDFDWDWIPYTPGGPDDPFAGGGGGGGSGSGGGKGGNPSGSPKPPALKKVKGSPPKFKKRYPDMTPAERKEADRANLQYHFPNMKGIEITGERGKQNCLAFALEVVIPNGKVGFEAGPTSDKELDGLLAKYGWRDDPNGKVAIGIWTNANGISHISRVRSDTLHESKFGGGGIQSLHQVTETSKGQFDDGFQHNNMYTGTRLRNIRRGTILQR
jgi:hypothetical protein